jgi:hypothetical protein
VLRQITTLLLLAGLTAGCSKQPTAPAAPAPDVPAPAAAVPAPAPTPAPAIAVAGQAYNQRLELQGITFMLVAPNDPAGNTLTLAPQGLAGDNSMLSQQVDGLVTGAEVGDLDADGSPEVYVYVQSPDADARGSVVAYAANNRHSLSMVYMPPLADSPGAEIGYRGHDEFAVLENALGRRFPIHDAAGAPTGKTRQLQYRLTAGEAGWVLKPEPVLEF